MTGQPWTPAPKKGIIPLHPMTFGMILSRSFGALRRNPKVLFGFAVILQLIVVVATAIVMGLVVFGTFDRVSTLSPSSPDFDAVVAGAVATNIVAGLAVSAASVAFTAIMQGIVAADIGFATVGVKASIGTLWRRMRPAFWRLLGFASLSLLFVFGILAIAATIVVAIVTGSSSAGPEIVFVAILAVLGLLAVTVPLMIWLSTKLLLVPAILVLEGASLRTAFVRSWRLTRRRFWVAFGVVLLISLIMGIAMQVVNVPLTLLGGILGSLIAPTGAQDLEGSIGFVALVAAPQLLLLVLQAISTVVQCTGASLVYVDSRMRYEGLDQALISHVERRDLGWTPDQLGDPFAVDPASAVSSTPPPKPTPAYGAPPTGYGYVPQPYPAQPYPAQEYPAQQYPAQPPGYPPFAPPAPPAPPASPAPRSSATPPTDSPWAAPGSS